MNKEINIKHKYQMLKLNRITLIPIKLRIRIKIIITKTIVNKTIMVIRIIIKILITTMIRINLTKLAISNTMIRATIIMEITLSIHMRRIRILTTTKQVTPKIKISRSSQQINGSVLRKVIL